VLLPLALTLSLAGPGEAPEGQVVDLVVARVNDAVLTLSELVAQTGLVLLRGRGPEVARGAALSRALLGSVLDAAINELLLYQEVRRLQLAEISAARIRQAYARDRSRFASEAQLEAFASTYGFRNPDATEGPPPLWSALLRRELAVEAFLRARARLESRPSRAAVLRCYADNAAYFAGRTFRDAEPEIRARIEAQRRARAAGRLVEDLRRRARVRVTPGFEPPAESAEPAEPASDDFVCPLDDDGP